MRLWEIGRVGVHCGTCDQDLAGHPVQFIEIAGLKRRLARCELHAEGEPPELILEDAKPKVATYHPPPGLEAPGRLDFEAAAQTSTTTTRESARAGVRDGLIVKPQPAKLPTADLTSLRLQVERAQAKLLRARGKR